MKTEFLTYGELDRAAELIIQGGAVACPTETVYGMLANALSEAAIEHVYEAKNRPETKPISVFVRDMRDAEKLCRDIPPLAYELSEKYWPGPLTMILRKRPDVPDILTAGGDTVGVRCPDSRAALELLRLTGLPLTGTSANKSGEPNVTTAEEAMRVFDGDIEAVITDPTPESNLPSTIVDLTGDRPRVLRQGAIEISEQ